MMNDASWMMMMMIFWMGIACHGFGIPVSIHTVGSRCGGSGPIKCKSATPPGYFVRDVCNFIH